MLEIKNLSKQFDGNYVLNNVSMTIEFGKIYGLIGANGSGKSTLMNILNGHEKIAKSGGYEGKIFLDGEEVLINNHLKSIECGIAMVHQELALFSSMSATENIKINKENVKHKGFLVPEFAYLDEKKNEQEAEELLHMIGSDISPEISIDFLSLNQKQFVEIARELDNKNIRLLILDEPTSSLNITETEKLLNCIKEIAAKNIAVIFISHRLEEIMEICDKVFVLRDGNLISDYEKEAFSVDHFAEDMVGTEVIKAIRKKKTEFDHVLMRYQNIQGSGQDFEIYEGEIVGITGLAGQGQEQFSEGLFGLRKAFYDVWYKGEKLTPGNTAQLIDKKLYYLSEDRANTSLFLESPIWKNIIFGTEGSHPEFYAMEKFLPLSFLKKKTVIQHTEKMIEKLNIVCAGPNQNVKDLSGGNQQKVCIGRAITFCPELLFVGEPTRGIDVYSKELILNSLVGMNQEYNTTVVISSGELEELIRICDRVVVMYQGQVFKIFDKNMDLEEITLSLYGREQDEE